MNVRTLATCAAFLLVFEMSSAFAAQQWNCKYHWVDSGGGNGPDISDTLIEESATTLSGFLDDLSGTREQYTIIQNSQVGLIAVLPPRTKDSLQLQAILLDKKSGAMKLVATMAGGTYMDINMGKCIRAPR
jgi:hypothetical protein